MRLEDAIENQHDSCKMIFVSWRWAIGIVATEVLALVVMVAAASGNLSASNEKINAIIIKDQEQDKRIQRIEDAISSIERMENDVQWIRKELEE